MRLRTSKRVKLSRSATKLPQARFRREKRRATARRIVGSVLVLLVLAIGTGIGYTWYMGEYAQPSIQAAPAPKGPVKLTPPRISQTGRIGVSIQTVTSPVVPGDNASLSIRTNPQANCSVVIEYDDEKSIDGGLKPKKADEFGTATWSWTVEPNRPEGTWPIEVTCRNKKNSAVINGNFVVER